MYWKTLNEWDSCRSWWQPVARKRCSPQHIFASWWQVQTHQDRTWGRSEAGYWAQALLVDGYEGYQPACEQYHITRLGCWAHARRKFVDAQKLQPKGKTGKPDQLLAYIQALYRIEKTIKHHPPDERYRIRQQQSKPLIDKMRKWLIKNLSQVPPKTALGKALYYLDHQWPRLVRYLEDGHYPMDNNSAENAIRPFAVGRKNWLFAKSQAGARASANLYGLIETAKANQLNPFEYLKVVFKELPNAQTLEQIEVLLPSQYKLTVDEWRTMVGLALTFLQI